MEKVKWWYSDQILQYIDLFSASTIECTLRMLLCIVQRKLQFTHGQPNCGIHAGRAGDYQYCTTLASR